MRKTISVISVIAFLAAPAAFAADASKEETIGVGAGSVIGAIAGGPVGFIVGAAIGAKIGDNTHKKNEEIEKLAASLDNSEGSVAVLKSDIRTLNKDVVTLGAELERIQDVARPEVVNLLQAGIAMDLLFRTDEHTLTDMTGSRLAEFADMLSTLPDIVIQLDGFADERGDSDYNLVLSQKRVEFVRDQLVAAGVDPSRVRISAYGEAPAQDDSVDSYALERRVSMTVFIENSPSFASNPQ